ncbi:DUF4359 domain-containing protein [Cyanobacterium stanieri LEGE 03274]|uniref:DUF4359 domain-containing protein n=1 Tax=Cyanobacterium stanieri LEGE 03274 TaxID=1828756 RepID=A0ABR9V523_9CHRO|nr:DUF4359 domain-containing protein [Cyanobacterium stanieri]MBE9223000.1 DUF4359 domain-containing protein [Cyanobacterium stanieri LEGE 03274]
MNHLSPSKSLPLSTIAIVSGTILAIFGGILMFTNPNQRQYEEFAEEKLSLYAKENLCQAGAPALDQVLKSQVCHMMVEAGKRQIPRVVRETTQRKNYMLLSIYETNLYLYQFRTIGVFNNFYVLNVDQLYDQN